ncbi:hypothetical protein U4E84_11250 [Halorubrum sp. AD140]|uniref:hypothetical protein n=1 Tax=Halorubrum sp. AD140 TaxID=3050073 RepID=UPI002ACCC388|nr:hypothetical protein [Halorubrum sp. AD140]MDZ5811918.1 hypothetical protein [Halorubrum sp. AD140]
MEKDKGAAEEITERTGYDPAILAAIGSVALAWYQFYVRGNKHYGLFIGLWPPTLLAFSSAIRDQQRQRKSREQDHETD